METAEALPKASRRATGYRDLVATRSKPGGRRVSVYRPELVLAICERLAEGETMSEICATPGMPAASTVRRWALDKKPVWEALSTARGLKADSLFDEALDMARALREEPGNSQNVRAYDVVMSHLRWAAAKLNPQQYSDRSLVNVTVPIQINTTLDLGTSLAGSGAGSVYDVTATIVEEVDATASEAAAQADKTPKHKRQKDSKSGKAKK